MCNAGTCRYARGMRSPIATTELAFVVQRSPDPEAVSTALRIGAAFVICWGVLLLGILGLTPLGLGLAGQLVHYGMSIRRGDTVAISMGWSTTTAMGVVTLLVGATPVMLAAWMAFLALSLFLTVFLNPIRGRRGEQGRRASLRPLPPFAHEMTPRRTA